MSKLFEMIREDIYHIKVLDRELLEYPLFECSMGSFEGMKGLGTEKHWDYLYEALDSFCCGNDEYRLFDKMCFLYDRSINDKVVPLKNKNEYYERSESCVFVDFLNKKAVVVISNDVSGYCKNITDEKDIIYIYKMNNFQSLEAFFDTSLTIYFPSHRYTINGEAVGDIREYAFDDLYWNLASTAFSIDQINNSRDVFIMEESVAGRRFKPKNKNKYENKTKYRIIKPVDFVRKYLKRDDVEGTKKCDHFRRGHWRTFRSDRYKNVQGDRTWIDAVWIGESEATMKNVRYKIRLDL